MRATLVLAVCLVTAALAGCATSPGATSEKFTISRQIRILFDSENINAESSDPYDYVETSFVVRVNGDAIAPAAATIVYQDESGAIVSKSLAEFTTLATLPAGTEVRVTGANLTSSASLLVGGVEVVSRARPHTEWWNVGGYPIGVRMDPGSALAYKATGSASETFTFKDIRGSTPETDDFVLDLASLGFAVQYDATLDLSLASAPSNVVGEKEHSAFPLAWTTTGKLTLPVNVEASGRNTSSGQAITAGFALAPTSGVQYDANGKLWWNVSGSPVRADLSGGSWTSKVDATAWLTGVPEMEGSFSCAGKTKAEACVPTEIPESFKAGNGTLEAETVDLDGFPWNVKPDVVANLTRFLDEDLVPGDELRFDVDIDSSKIEDFTPESGGPESFKLTGGAILRAVDYESVTVAAGRSDALKLVERVDVRLEVGAVREDGETVLKPFVVEQRFVDTTMWLQKETFIPLRIDQTMPIDLDRMVDAVLDNLGEGAWDDSPIAPLTGRNVDATVEGRSSMELTRNTPGTRFSPYAVIAGFHSVGFLPLIAASSSMGGYGGDTVSVAPYPSTYPYGEMGHDGMDGYAGEGAAPTRELLLALADKGAASGDTKEYTVASVRGEATYGELLFTLDEEYLGYGGAESGTWCLVVAGACAGFMDGYASAIEAGDVLRFVYDGIAGASLTAYDGQSGDILVELVVR